MPTRVTCEQTCKRSGMGRGPNCPPPATKTMSERILQPKLQLAHGDARSQAVDCAKTLMGSVRRRARKWCARQDVAVGSSPVRMVQYIERFRPELKLMMFVVGHNEVFVYFGVDGENSRSDGGVSSDTAELSHRCFDEGGTVVPPRGVRVRDA